MSAAWRTQSDERIAAEQSPRVEATTPTRQLPATLMEGHRGATVAAAAILLVLTGLLVGTGVGELGIHVINAVLAHVNPVA